MKPQYSLIAIVLVTASTSALAVELTPGRYAISASVEMGPIPKRVHDSEECISQEDLNKNPQDLMGGNERANQDCQVSEWQISDGVMRLQMQCTVPGGGTSVVVGEGKYDTTSFEMHNQMTLNAQGMEMKMTAHTTGKRLGDC